MKTDLLVGDFTEYKLLNKKRAKSKDPRRNKSKSKKHKRKDHRNKSKRKIISKIDDIKELRNLENVKQNYRHFFHINWEDNIYVKEALKIGEAFDPYIYWFLINSTYFVEENIQENMMKIKEGYFDSMPEYINNINCNELVVDHDVNGGFGKDNFNMESLESFNIKNKKGKKKDKEIISIIDYLNHDKNSFVNVFGYSSAKDKLSIFKYKLKNYINIFHHINDNKIDFLENKTKFIEEVYDQNNNVNDDYDVLINDDPMYEKNKASYAILNKLAKYLFIKEKRELINQGYDLYDNYINDNKKEEDEEEEEDEISNCCLVCNNCDVTQYSSYYECTRCNIKVHPFCYGIRLKTESKGWKCDICKEFKEMTYEKSLVLECLLCPNKGGVLKKSNIAKNSEIYKNLTNFRKENIPLPLMNPSEFIPLNNNNNINKQEYAYVHLSCALWNKDVKFGNYESKSNISLLSQNIYNKYKSHCSICKKDNYGPTVKCKYENCSFQCHPECARISNCFLEVILVDRAYEYNIYCHNHHLNKFAKLLNNIISYNSELIFAFDDALRRVFRTYRIKYKKEFYYPERDEEFNKFENPIKLIEDNESEDNYSNCNSEISIKSDKYHKSPFRNKLYFKRKKNNKNKNFNGNDNNENYVKSIEINTKDISAIKYKNNYINEFILSPYKVNHNTNEFLEDKNINSNNNKEFAKADKNLQNILLTENTQSKTISSTGISINISQNDNNSNIDNNSTIINNISNINNFSKITIITNINNYNNNTEIRFLSLEEEVEKNKESFIIYLVGFLDDYFKKNRIIVCKGNGYHYFPKDEDLDNDILNEMSYEELFTEDFPVCEMYYKGFSTYYIKKYLKIIFNDENKFYELFTSQIDNIIKKLKKNEKLLKNKKIICKYKDKCIGKEKGVYNLLDVERFKYLIFSEKDIPKSFICDACLENNNCDEIFS